MKELTHEEQAIVNKAYEVLAQNEVTAKLTMIGLRGENISWYINE